MSSSIGKREGTHLLSWGGALIINEQRYSYRDIDKLPEGISMEAAKLVELEDGWAFQGHHAFLSTMYPRQIKHDGHDFHCSEQIYYYDMTVDAGDQRALEGVRDCKDGDYSGVVAAQRSKASGEKCWCRGFESRRWQLAFTTPSSGKTCCSIKGQSFSYYVYVVWEVKKTLSR